MHDTFRKIFEKNLELLNKPVVTQRINEQFEVNSKYIVHKIGEVYLPTGQVVIGDPLCYLGTKFHCAPNKRIAVGTYPVYLSILDHEVFGMRYLSAKLAITNQQPVHYERVMNEGQKIEDEGKLGVISGFGVETGLGSFCDRQTEELYSEFLKKWHTDNVGSNHYDDYFESFFAKSYQKEPEYQHEGGDYLDWSVPNTRNNIVMFASGFGDGYYDSYWGMDKNDEICCLVTRFIDPEAYDIPMPEVPIRKRYYPVEGGFQKLVDNNLGCIATDRITVDGCKVDYMYREETDFEGDSGWRFFGGGETQKYLDNPNNSGIYGLNTIANYDSDIIPFLEAPVGKAYYRDNDGKLYEDAER